MASVPGPELKVVELSDEELQTKTLHRSNLITALEALHEDGIVVIKNAVDPAHLDKLNARMVPQAEELFARPTTHRNFGDNTDNIQQEPVLEPGYIFQDILANPWACAITQQFLGPNPSVRLYSANTAFRATARQPVHVDVAFAFPRLPFGCCLNINLVDTSPANGATEVWPGTHADAGPHQLGAHGTVRPEVVEARRKVRPPVQPALPKGSLIIRDMRLWHAGRPNSTDAPRVMLVTVQFARWYACNSRMVLPAAAREEIEWGPVVPCAEWVGPGYDYLKGAHDHDFTLLPA